MLIFAQLFFKTVLLFLLFLSLSFYGVIFLKHLLFLIDFTSMFSVFYKRGTRKQLRGAGRDEWMLEIGTFGSIPFARRGEWGLECHK